MLQEYEWPGNVRELVQLMARALLECSGDVIEPAHLILDPANTPAPAEMDWVTRDEHERRYFQAVLEHTRWVVKGARGAAAILGIPESTLRDQSRRLGLQRPGERGG